MKKLLLLLTTIAFMGCWDGSYDYKTVATYQATASNIKVDITAIGHVLEGEDLGEGLAKGIISNSNFTDTIYFQARIEKLTALRYKKDTIEIIKPYDIGMSLMYCLDNIGCSDYDRKELKELGEVIRVIAYGPKGTYMKGQTEVIDVLYTDFKTY